MSNNSSDSSIPGGLAPVGGWKSGETPQTTAPPVVPTLGTIGGNPLTTNTLSKTPVARPGSSRYDPLAPPPPHMSGAESATVFAPPGMGTTPATPQTVAPKLVAQPSTPATDKSYSLAAAYRRGEVEPMTPARMIAGILAGLIAGGIATTFWIGLYLAIPVYQIMWLAGGMGFIVGWSVFKATNEGEETSCWISCIISFLYAASGVAFINYRFYTLVGIPDIVSAVFGIVAVGLATERGFRTPEVLAVDTAV